MTYERASSQAINFGKLGIFFSSNCTSDNRAYVSSVLGVTNPLDHGRYLGLSSLICRRKIFFFPFLKDQLWKRVKYWNGKFLSKAGKEILLKFVAQAIPSYVLSVFSIHVSLCDKL